MSRLAGWFRSGGKADAVAEIDADSPKDKDSMAKEMEEINDAMTSAGLIMNDDIDGAWKRLQTGNSSFHQLGMAVSIFMRSILGFEKDVMAETTAKLAECETKAWNDYKKAQKDGKMRSGSKLYPPGTEFELVRAEAQLMGAVVGVLHESLIEAMKSFYKLRKAFVTLDGIIESEGKALGQQTPGASSTKLATYEHMPGSFDDDEFDDSLEAGNNGNAKSESVSGTQTPVDQTKISTGTTTPDTTMLEDLKLEDGPPKPLKEATSKVATDVADLENLDNPLDIFVHSGANMCFGMMLLILTLIPPSFSRILSIVGFRGDRARGVRMLWRSTEFDNMNGAVAGMGLLAYYNGLLGSVDVLPADMDFDDEAEMVGPPKEKCEKLLSIMRVRYPDSRFWRIEEARQHSNSRNITKAIEILQSGSKAKMKQVAALNNFELSLNAMFIQNWELARDSFLHCLEVNDWSPALYYYIAGCASVELYRDAHFAGDKGEARRQKTKAEEYLRKAPTMTGKKRIMARQMPLETFLQRKVQRWEDRAKANKADLLEAIGPSPIMELVYMWNGSRRMNDEELERGIKASSWERCTGKVEVAEKIKKEVDEMGIWALGNSAMLRRLGKVDEAKKMLDEHILKLDKTIFKGPNMEDYVVPAAVYELGAIAWNECCAPIAGTDEEVKAFRVKKLKECETQLEAVANWESFLLDARIGMRVQSGLETLKWFKAKMRVE